MISEFGILAAIIIMTLAGGLFFICRHKVYYHFKTVVGGQVYRSGTLGKLGLWLVLRQYRIKTIINLRTEKERRIGDWYTIESRFCKQNKIRLVNIPMQLDTPPDRDQIRLFLDVAMDPDRQPALIHCEVGVIRTGMMVAVFLKHRFNTPNDKILKELPLFGHSLDRGKHKREKVKAFILGYRPEKEWL